MRDRGRTNRPYLAGFFDGEGCIYARNGLQVSAVQIDPRPLEMLQAEFGGRVRPPRAKQKSQTSTWVIYGPPATRALEAMLPYLVVKREQAEIAIRYAALVLPRGGTKVPEETREERARLRGLLLRRRTAHVTRREDEWVRRAS